MTFGVATLQVADILQSKLGGGGGVDLCCTGSLYLVGDVLSRTCKEDLGQVLNL